MTYALRMGRGIGLLVIAAAFVVMLPPDLRADTFTVTKVADVAGSTCSATDCSLRQAISAANDNPGPDTISVPAGTYTLTIAGAGEDLNATGDLDITGAVTIEGDAAGGTIIDGGAIDRVFHITNTAGATTLKNLTIQNGRTGGAGGGIYRETMSQLRLEGCKVQSNQSTGTDGGGIATTNFGMVQLVDTSLLSNTAASDGGGMLINNSVLLDISGGTISGNHAAGSGGGFYFTGPGDLTISGTKIDSNTAGTDEAGFFTNTAGTKTISTVTVSNNTATANAGGFRIIGVGDVVISGSTISGNQAQTGESGGFYVTGNGILLTGTTISGNKAKTNNGGGFVGSPGTVELQDLKIQNNVAETGAGGGLFIANANSLSLTNVEVSGNTAVTQVGGLYANSGHDIQASGLVVSNNSVTGGQSGGAFLGSVNSVSIDRSAFQGNSASTAYGGLNVNSAATAITDSTVDSNTSGTGPAAGISVNGLPGSTLKITGSTISRNVSTNSIGGGINAMTGILTMTNDTVSANTAKTLGGGLYSAGPAATLTNVTFQGNSADTGGGGIYVNGGTLTLRNSIVAGSIAGHDCGIGLGGIVSGGHNIASDATCLLTAAGDLPNTDPLLTALELHGGTTMTHALQATSPAIDAGDDALAPTSDQRGVIRPIDGNGDGVAVSDIGAFEAGCGDGVVNVGEECDDGNAVDTDACRNSCRNAVCGDSVVEEGVEQCDDGNTVDADACLNNCHIAACGDGVVQEGVEECDDGNVADGDGCSATCTIEASVVAAADSTGGGCSLIPSRTAAKPSAFWRDLASRALKLLR